MGTSDITQQILAIDIGNTTIDTGLYRGETLITHWRIATDRERTADEHAMLLRALCDHVGFSWADLSGAIIASVVPPLTGPWEELCQHYLGLQPLIIGRDSVEVGVQVLTDHPAEVGADRIVNSLAAYRRYGGPCIVIDFGTATSFDVISRTGDFLGGVIAPGLGIAAEALTSRTAKLPRIELVPPPHVIGKNTVHCMQAGLVVGYACLVEGLVQRIQVELPDGPGKVIATGGLGETVARLTPVIEAVDPSLTLDGLRMIYEMNR
ncbi:MAG: type III pantothenate kinase [Anaerolineae bacterium]|nr:type III pantothenate kinase [Anaerolineae bacterium]